MAYKRKSKRSSSSYARKPRRGKGSRRNYSSGGRSSRRNSRAGQVVRLVIEQPSANVVTNAAGQLMKERAIKKRRF